MTTADASGIRPAIPQAPPGGGPSPQKPASGSSSSYGEILRSSALVGGASALNIVIGIVRTKIMAMLLGPAGFGLMGALNAIADLARAGAEMGINGSGVRQIAESASSNSAQRVARTVIVLRRVSIALGLIGALVLAALAAPLSQLTFEDAAHTAAVATLGLAVFLRLLADGRTAMVQGLRRIGDMARINVFSAVLGTVLAVAVVYRWGAAAAAWAVVCIAGATALTAWWYSRKVVIEKHPLSVGETVDEVRALLRLGVAFMASGLLMMGAGYAARMIVIRHVGLEAAGLYQAAWTLAGLYVGVLLQAMGTDFYPRLVGAIKQPPVANRLVNEQAHVSLLLTGAGVLATLTFAPWVIKLFYTPQFVAATETLRWMCLGMALRVVSFPIGYVIVAKGSRGVYIGTELAWTVVNVLLSWWLVSWFGLVGVGVAFFGSYLFHITMIYPIVRRMTGFRWSRDNLRLMATVLGPVGLVFAGFYVLPDGLAMAAGALASVALGLWALRALRGLPGAPAFLSRLPLPGMRGTGASADTGKKAGP